MRIGKIKKPFLLGTLAVLLIVALCAVPLLAPTAYASGPDSGGDRGGHGDRDYGGHGDRDYGGHGDSDLEHSSLRHSQEEEKPPVVLITTNIPSIITNAADYAADQTPVITVSHLAPNTNTTVTVTAPDGTITDMAVTTDKNGNATVVYAPSGGLLKGDYNITATDGTITVTASFTDAVSFQTWQWANNKGTPTNDDWINGDLNGNNSHYNEGGVVPFLCMVTGFTTTTYTITITYDYSRSGVGGYDYIDSFNATEISVLTTPPPDGTPFSGTLTANGPFRGYNVAITGWTTPSDITLGGNTARQFDLGLDFSSSNLAITDSHGDSAAWVLWGGHLAKESTAAVTDPLGSTSGPWGAGQGASSISGAPLHMDTDPGGNMSLNKSAIFSGGATLQINKEGPQCAHVGDTITYTYYVYNGTSSNYSAGNIQIVDNKAGTIAGSASHTVLNEQGSVGNLENGETWVYTKTYTVLGTDPDPLINTANLQTKATGVWSTRDTDTWSVDILHPGISVTKTGPATANVGDTINYTIQVTLPQGSEDTPLHNIIISDPPLGINIPAGTPPDSGDDGDNILESGETWVYTVSYVVQAGDAPLLSNTADAWGTDQCGGTKGTVTDDDSWTLSIIVTPPPGTPLEPPTPTPPTPTPTPPAAVLGFEGTECPERLTINLMGTVAEFPVTTDCTLCVNVAMTSPDGSFTLNIPAGTQVLNSDGTYAYTNPDPDLVGTFAGTPAPPAGATIVRAYQLSPDGIVFNNHVATLAAQYDPEEAPPGSTLIWAYYDDNAGLWVDMDTAGYVAAAVEVPNILATTTAHFTYFAILAK